MTEAHRDLPAWLLLLLEVLQGHPDGLHHKSGKGAVLATDSIFYLLYHIVGKTDALIRGGWNIRNFKLPHCKAPHNTFYITIVLQFAFLLCMMIVALMCYNQNFEVRKMENFPKYYTLLFNAVTDAIHDLDKQNYGDARARLVKAQQDAEDAFLAAGDEEVCP